VIPLARRPRRVAGTRPAGDVGTLWIPPDGTALTRLPRASLALLQQILITLGYTDSGAMRADGLPGTHTRNATTAFQRDMQPARLAAETTPLGERVRAFASIVGSPARRRGPRPQDPAVAPMARDAHRAGRRR
jgi:peptidoglycan hydrolase-like protein with peptidoglycan-binding domain